MKSEKFYKIVTMFNKDHRHNKIRAMRLAEEELSIPEKMEFLELAQGQAMWLDRDDRQTLDELYNRTWKENYGSNCGCIETIDIHEPARPMQKRQKLVESSVGAFGSFWDDIDKAIATADKVVSTATKTYDSVASRMGDQGQDPYGQDPYGQDPYGQDPYQTGTATQTGTTTQTIPKVVSPPINNPNNQNMIILAGLGVLALLFLSQKKK